MHGHGRKLLYLIKPTPMTKTKEENRYRILEKKDGFRTVFYVEYRQKFLWLFWHWVKCVNPNHKEHFGTSFNTEEDARDYISKAIVPTTKTYQLYKQQKA
jgi:hypothetical protein